MKKKLWIMIVAVLLLVLVGGYLGYKIYYLNYYDLSNLYNFDEYKENLVISDKKITIKTTTLNEEEYFTYKNMKMQNIFDGAESKFNSDEFEHPHDTDSIWYILKDEETGESVASVGLGRGPQMFEYFNLEDFSFPEDERIKKNKDMVKVFKKYNIKNDIDFLKFIVETKNHKNSIFDSVEEMEDLYAIYSLNFVTYAEEIILIDGDYEGYIVKHDMDDATMIECTILKDDKIYSFTFNNSKYFTDEMINKFLNTLVIE